MNKKNKGTTAERELIKMFWEIGWAGFRAAGSGSARHPCPDVIAGNSLRKLGLEIKSIASNKHYFLKKEIEELREFSFLFGCEAWIGVKFQGKGWHFFSIEDLRETSKGYSVSFNDHLIKGFSFNELIKTGY